MPSRNIAKRVAAEIGAILPPSDLSLVEEDRLLWKLGFDVARYDQKYFKFRSSLNKLRESALQTGTRLTDMDRESIRSSGVNCFVHAERFIEELVSYNVWLLSQDQFGFTSFNYSFEKATAVVEGVLGRLKHKQEEELVWRPAGGNTFGVLLAYARAAANWMLSLGDKDRDAYRRPKDHLPHFAKPGDKLFPFAHTALWADADKAELRDFATQFDGVVQSLEQSKIAEIRNGVGHYRDKDRFPLTDAILACESRLTCALDMADISRLVPKTFWMRTKTTREFGISDCEMVDYADRKINIAVPQVMSGLQSPQFGKAYLIPAAMLLGRAGSRLILTMREESAFRAAWMNYPPRVSLADMQPSRIDDESGVALDVMS